jgi:hypothetical protein
MVGVISEELAVYIVNPEDGVNRFLLNVGTYLPIYISSYVRIITAWNLGEKSCNGLFSSTEDRFLVPELAGETDCISRFGDVGEDQNTKQENAVKAAGLRVKTDGIAICGTLAVGCSTAAAP